MIELGLRGVDFITANTDLQALEGSCAHTKVQLGQNVTRGLGSGGDPEVGRRSAIEDRERMREILGGADMVFVTAGMGGGTGTGAAPIIAEIARETGALTVGVVTKPFLFEGKVRMRQADDGIQQLKRCVDTLITIPNQRLLNVVGKNTRLRDAFRKADEVLHNAVKGISDTITVSGLVNVDFADVRTVMSEMGMALMGEGIAQGENRAVEAAQRAISSPLLEDISIDGARGMLVNVTAGNDLTLHEVHEAITLIQESVHPDANVIFGAVIDDEMEEEIRITVIATGIGRAEKAKLDLDKKVASIAGRTPFAGENVFQDELDVPTFRRTQRKEADPLRIIKAGGTSSRREEADLDVPTFLRQPVAD
jgi:cell division protein FtsZ